jgi:hypothetical protein
MPITAIMMPAFWIHGVQNAHRRHHPDPLQHRCDDSGRYRGAEAGTGEPFRRTQPSADTAEAG